MLAADKQIYLFIPALLSMVRRVKVQQGVELHAPVLAGMLSGLNRRKCAGEGLHGTLFGSLGSGDTGYAQRYYQFEFAAQAPSGKAVLLATPIHLITGMTDIVVDHDPVDDLDAGQAQQLCNELNAHFVRDGLEFVLSSRGNIYLLLPVDEMPGPLPALEKILGQSLYGMLERTHDTGWNRMLNEMQMLLHGSSVNIRRETAGQRMVSSVWLWGNGKLSSSQQDAHLHGVYGGGLAGEVLASGHAAAWHARIPERFDKGTSAIIIEDLSGADSVATTQELQLKLDAVDELVKSIQDSLGPGDQLLVCDAEGKVWFGRKNVFKRLFTRQTKSLLDL